MKFRAFTDPVVEVEKAIQALEMMMAPDLKSTYSRKARVPEPVSINFGRKMLMPDCIIRSMSTLFDKEKDKNGNLIRADVSLQVETNRSVSTDLEDAFKGS